MNRLVFWCWSFIAAGLVSHQVWLWTGGLEVETNLLALLPEGTVDPVAEKAMARATEATSRSVVVVVGAASEREALTNAQRVEAALLEGGRLKPVSLPELDVEALKPFRGLLLSASQRRALESETDEQLAQRALAFMYSPVGQNLASFRDDPLQLHRDWLLERVRASRVHPVDGRLLTEHKGRVFVLLRYEVPTAAFALDGTAPVAREIERVRASLPEGVELLAAGVPLFAEAAASQASAEASTVGLGSLLAIIVLMLVAFQSGRPLVLVMLSVGMGLLAGLSVTSVVFGRVHLITLVFGAALVGVAEDYGIHYFASRQKHHLVGARETLQSLLPALLMALVTTVAGYGVLGLAPFPGLRQMAVFSSVGVAAAFATVAAWFPVFDRGVVPMSRLSRWWSTTRARIPRLSAHQAVVLCGVLGSLGVGSLAFGRVDDDIRGLATSDATLMATQQRVATIVGLPSPAQFLVVRGSTQAEILEREERVTLALEPMVASGNLKGFQAISTWVPSPSTQAANARLFQRARHVALTAASELLEESNVDDPPALGPLTVEAFFHLPFSSPFRALFSEGASVVLLDSPRREAFQQLEQLSALPGVTFVDKTAAMSALLGQWRLRMAQLLIIGFAATFLILAWRFGRRAMRAFAPTVVASLGAIAVTVLLGEPITLFHVLATWILLGIGVDYGIFLLEHPSENAGEAWLAVGLGAVSTLLSFGLLSLSRTFALHAFGQTIGIGLVLVWVLSPLVVDARSESRGEAH